MNCDDNYELVQLGSCQHISNIQPATVARKQDHCGKVDGPLDIRHNTHPLPILLY